MTNKRKAEQRDATTRDVLKFIKQYKRDHSGNSPTMREVSEGCFVALSTVPYHLKKLEAMGKIYRQHRTARGIILNDDEP